jgi:MFS family permease
VFPCGLFILMGSMDRANVAFAALQMNTALGLTSMQYGFGAGILFAGYITAKFPSVLLFEKIGMHRWLALITLMWGVAATSMALIESHTAYYLLRFLVGVAEGGLSSGVMLYLSHWASDRYRASILAIPIAAVSISQVIVAPLSGWLLESGNPLGWEGWRWMFLMEGLPSLLLAVFAYFNFPDRPRQARWLNSTELGWLQTNVVGALPPQKGRPGRWTPLRNRTTWFCALLWFCLLAGNFGVIFWLPLVVRGLSGITTTEVGLIVALPWLGSAIGLFLNARHSDQTGERFLHVAVPAVIAAGGLVGAYLLGPGLPGLVVLTIAGTCLGSTVSPFWAIPTKLIPPAGLAVGIVAINFVGSFAGLTIPALVGVLRDRTGSFAGPTYTLAGILLAAALLCLVARHMENRQLKHAGALA